MKTFKNLGHGIIRLLLCSLLLASAAAYNSNKGVARRMVGSASPKGSKGSGGGGSPFFLVHPGCAGECLTIRQGGGKARSLLNGPYLLSFEECENDPSFFWVHESCGDSGEYYRLRNVDTHMCIAKPNNCDDPSGDPRLVDCHTPEAAIFSDFLYPPDPDEGKANLLDARCWLVDGEVTGLVSDCGSIDVDWERNPGGETFSFWLKKPAECLHEIFYENMV